MARQRDLIEQFADLVLRADDSAYLAQRSLEIATATTDGRAAAIFKLERDALALFAARGIDQAVLDAMDSIWRHHRKRLEQGAPYYAPEFSSRRPGPLAVAVVPVVDGDSLVALLYLDSENRAFCTEDDLEWLHGLGRIIAKAAGVAKPRSAITPASGADSSSAASAAPATGSREELLLALKQHDWNISKAARALGVTRRTIYLRLERFKVKNDKRAGAGAGLMRPATADE